MIGNSIYGCGCSESSVLVLLILVLLLQEKNVPGEPLTPEDFRNAKTVGEFCVRISTEAFFSFQHLFLRL